MTETSAVKIIMSDETGRGFAMVKKGGKFNFVNKYGVAVSDKWFDSMLEASFHFVLVKRDGTYELTDMNGKFIRKKR